MAIFTQTIGFSGGDEVDGIMEISITEDGYKFINKAKSEIAKSEILNSADVINAVSLELFYGNIEDYNTPEELSKVKELGDWEEESFCRLVDFEAVLEHNSFYVTANYKHGSGRICAYDSITTEELDDFFIKPSKEAELIETLYGQDSEIIRTCEKYVLSRRNIYNCNEFLVHKIIRNEEKVLLEQIACEEKLEKAETVFQDSCDAEVLEIRFLRQGFVKAPKPDGFDVMSNEQDVKILITNVNWDGTDDFKEPIKLVVPKEAFENSDDESFRDNIEEYIADEISNISGFCHDGFSYEIIIDNYLSTRSLLEKAIAIKLEHYVFSNFSIEPAEEIQEYLKDAENPMVFSLYGVWEDGENIEYHFDMSDVEKAIINDDLSITIDGKKIEILVPIKRDN